MSANSTTNGIDVSHYQGTVDWVKVKATGITFAYAKATDGNTYTDPQFHTNWQGMRAAGILRGAYHFYETNDDPVTQANNFINALGSLAANLQIWLDTVAFVRLSI